MNEVENASFEDIINKQNINADRPIFGKWAEMNKDYFSNPQIIEELYNLFEESASKISATIKIIDIGSAEGLVGEHFKSKLMKKYNIKLSILDIVKEHLDKNQNQETEKIYQDLLKWERKEEFSLAIVNSVLHYFSREGQLKVLKNIARALQPKGYLLLKTFIQIPNNLELFTTLNDIVGKKLQLLKINELKKLFMDAGFTKIDFLGDASTWNCSSESLKRRYNLSDIQIQEMRSLIEQTHPDKKVGFTQTKEEFTIPIYYKVFLLQK